MEAGGFHKRVSELLTNNVLDRDEVLNTEITLGDGLVKTVLHAMSHLLSANTGKGGSVCETLNYLNTLVEPDTGVGQSLDARDHLGEVIDCLVRVLV